MRTAHQQTEQRHRARAVKAEQQRVRKTTLEQIRKQIAEIHERRRGLLARVRRSCAAARTRVRAAVKARREAAREALNREIAEMRQAERNRCQLRKVRAREGLDSEAGRARARLEEQRHTDRLIRRIDAHAQRHTARHRAAEQRSESDDEVRGNIDAELVPIFDLVGKRIRAKPGLSRTEAFVAWVDENPDEVWQLRERAAHAELQRLLREQARAHRESRRAAVPF